MSKRLLLITLVLIALPVVLAACQETGDTAEDAAAAQQFIPNPAGYAEHETDNIQDAIASTLGGAGVLTGNIPQALIVGQINNFVDCYRDVGAFDARLHVQNVDFDNIRPPIAGVVAVINVDRAANNFVQCATDTGLNAQSRPVNQPCFDTGTFSHEGDSYLYFYGATDTPLCQAYGAHFVQYIGS